ncbi:MAG TPA: thiamine pyrophosphate-binding protein [Arenicellales bacterium]|nr:thiamine pyrophosphate-binding protein [Arenicellales bacterium]
MSSGGHLLVRCLEAQGVDRVFCVPGESYLDVLDGLHDSSIHTVVARQEGGAAMMAEADGKLTGRPGIAMVTRGPGAANAAAGVHVAQQDSTPLILFVGQVGRGMIGRDAFQEVDYRGFYGDMAKAVIQIEDAARIPELISRAFHLAMNGRPGPVVVPLPEDMLRDSVSGVEPVPRVEPAEPAPDPKSLQRFLEMLAGAHKPMLILGGSRWTVAARDAAREFAESWRLPVACEFRRQMLFDPRHPNYAGDVGLGANPALVRRIRESDLLILLGGRLPEVASGGYTLVDVPQPAQTLVHVHPGSGELGRVYAAALQVHATPERFLEAAGREPAPDGVTASTALHQQLEQAHREYLEWSTPLPLEAAVDPGRIVEWLRGHLPEDAIVCNGAGNHTQWLHRFYHYRGFATQLAPTSGSMGYGLPAAVAGGLRFPDRAVVCFSGDGCFQMTAMELATAVQYRVPIIVLVFDNGMHGTIRMHQERSYPGRTIATGLRNPDFCALARACGAHGELVSATGEFEAAFERAAAAGGPALIHIRTDPDVITPSASLSGIRRLAMESK